MRWFSGCSCFSPIWEKDVCDLGFSVYISDCLWSWLGRMAVYFIRLAVGAYCIRPSNILSGAIMHYAKTRLCCLWQHMWGVCNTPLPYTDKEGISNEKRGVFSSLIFFSCLDIRSFWPHDLLFLPWYKKRSKRRSRHQGRRPSLTWYVFGGLAPAKLGTFSYSRGTRPNFLALGRGLEFLLLLFFSQGKKRRSH